MNDGSEENNSSAARRSGTGSGILDSMPVKIAVFAAAVILAILISGVRKNAVSGRVPDPAQSCSAEDTAQSADETEAAPAPGTPAPAVTELTVPAPEEVSLSVGPAEILTYSGAVPEEGQTDEYRFTAENTGEYGFAVSGLYSGTDVGLYVLDSGGYTVAYRSRCSEGQGTAAHCEQGQTYTIRISRYTGDGSYTLTVGCRKAAADISAYSTVNDSIEYAGQCNVYSFTVPEDGLYRFEMSGLYSGTDVDLYLVDALGGTAGYNTRCGSGEGITAGSLKAGDVYEIEVCQHTGTTDYTLFVGRQKTPTAVGLYYRVYDSIEYTDQQNVYMFSSETSGTAVIGITGMQSDARVEVRVLDALGETVNSYSYFGNNDSLPFDFAAGETYKILVGFHSGCSSYCMSIQ